MQTTLTLYFMVSIAVISLHASAHQIPVVPIEAEKQNHPDFPQWYTDYFDSGLILVPPVMPADQKRAHFDPIMFRKRSSIIDPILF
ncbi:hypothetical protein D915_007086 [Fasciola hepatica]|uniref:Uncharacterized protein n=1 Tax=Fasciola hepatica TaxID=6192 RepID=A0A4E0R3T3_FASHE|nr:hypothetical protein D915_007086 [Fasciola hepatica]